MITAPRYALIGATGIGAHHLAAVRKLEAMGAVRLTAVADSALARSEGLAAEMTAGGVRTYVDYREMLRAEPGLNVVVISTPIPLHGEMTAACLERGLFVYLEKPPVPLVQQLEALLALKGHERVGVGFQMVNARWAQAIKAGIVEGKLGTLREIRLGACWPRRDAYYARNSSAGRMTLEGEPVFDGPATNALAHLIHNAMFFAGESLPAFGQPEEIAGALYRARAIESYDVACLRAGFPSGVTMTAALTHATEQALPYMVEVRGSEGWARVSGDGAVFESDCLPPVEGGETFEDLVDKTHAGFFDFVVGNRPHPATSLADCRGYVLATNGLLLSSGGIHSIPKEYIRTYQKEGDGGYDVQGLFEAVSASLATGLLFAEQAVPWAVKTQPVRVANLKKIDFPVA